MILNRTKRHVLFSLFAAVSSIAIFYLVAQRKVTVGISIATAYTSVVFLLAALSVGPINLYRGKITPASSYLRRDLGIWSALLAIVHTVAGLQAHLGGKFWFYFVFPAEMSYVFPIRYDLFGITNHLGLACMLVMLLLLALSNNRSLKNLGPTKWKQLQRTSYVLVFAIPLHGFLYQILEKRLGIYTVILTLMFMAILIFQGAGVSRSWKNKRQA